MNSKTTKSAVGYVSAGWNWPLATAVAFYFLTFGIISHLIIRWAYPVDDTYIHLTIARSFAEHGTWGINPGEFSATSSSPLWTLILAACIKLFGFKIWLPLACATLCSVGLLFQIDAIGRREQWTPGFRLGILLSYVFLIPLVPLSFLGMEHLLHCIIAIWIFDLFWLLPAPGQSVPRRMTWNLMLAFLLCVAVRFEGLFLVCAVGLMLLIQRRWKLAMGIGIAALTPLIIHGVISFHFGWTAMPASVVLKSALAQQGSLVGVNQKFIHLLSKFPGPAVAKISLVVIISLLMVFFIFRLRRMSARCFALITVFLLMAVQHVVFAQFGWFYRYEAYLIATELLVFALIVTTLLREKHNQRVYVLLICFFPLLVLPHLYRGGIALRKTIIATKNISDQQCQMAEFVKSYYPNSVIAANDIGAISCNHAARIVDLFGLAHYDFFWSKMHRNYNTSNIEEICSKENVQIAMVYDSWFRNEFSLPHAWRRIAEMNIENNQICGDSKVTFYAVAPGTEEKLAENLSRFAESVPFDVHITLSGK